ncbi:MAG: N-acetyl-gamma-glutamyl-phosphate reductase [Acidiferrobacteraceae bacterium]|nr:N-acetyl-gamma-glutamyl-phosphate reductase [Acidiferrobacteraceae bacterium]
MVEFVIMSRPKIFIDGYGGTTGLRIREWLVSRDDIEVITIVGEDYKLEAARRDAISESDITLLCLPDEAARESARWAISHGKRVLDSSSIHRIADDWVYGLPELALDQRQLIRGANRVSVPGCYPSAVILLLRPLIDAQILSPETAISIHALSGYSGGGKSLIKRWESPETNLINHGFEAPYALSRIHKHIAEMQRYTGLNQPPQFVPSVGPFYCGMRVQVPIHQALITKGMTVAHVSEALLERYENEPFVEVLTFESGDEFDEWSLDPRILNNTNQMRLHVFPNPDGHILLVGILDNLGKGAAGAALQSINIMLGVTETIGLKGWN